MNECEDCDRMDCRERGCIAPVSSEEIKRKALESSGIALWSAYCDKKMELEDAEDRIELLERVLTEIISQIDQGGYDGKVFARDYCIQHAREVLKDKQ